MFSFAVLFFCSLHFTDVFSAVVDTSLTGTWSTKSRKVITGPDFYDPVADRFKEPENTGISYSFTDDGYFEQAYFRAISNPTNPACPGGMLQFQHGTYNIETNGSLVLTPFAVDGRQLISSPCKDKDAIYFRFNRTEVFERYEVQIDPFHNVRRLILYRFDGSPMNPMFLVYDPPEMLPTKTLNPTAATTGRNKARRGLTSDKFAQNLHKNPRLSSKSKLANSDNWWWAGVIMTITGGAALLYTERPWKCVRKK